MRTIKSFVMRGGRITTRQRQGLDVWLKDYLLPSEGLWSLNTIFGREVDTILEIGFGMGASLLSMAQANPDVNYLGIEVHEAGLGTMAADLHEYGLTNVRLAAMDAVEAMQHHVADESLSGVQIFFPDPWPKKRHHKRRLIQPVFIEMITSKLKKGGFIHAATDWENYAFQMLEVLSANPQLMNKQSDGGFMERPSSRPLTKFEKRGVQSGHHIRDVYFIKY